MEDSTFDKFKDSLIRIAPNEFEATDPETGGKWVVRANMPIGEMVALYAIGDRIKNENIAPAPDSQVVVDFEIKIGE